MAAETVPTQPNHRFRRWASKHPRQLLAGILTIGVAASGGAYAADRHGAHKDAHEAALATRKDTACLRLIRENIQPTGRAVVRLSTLSKEQIAACRLDQVATKVTVGDDPYEGPFLHLKIVDPEVLLPPETEIQSAHATDLAHAESRRPDILGITFVGFAVSALAAIGVGIANGELARRINGQSDSRPASPPAGAS